MKALGVLCAIASGFAWGLAAGWKTGNTTAVSVEIDFSHERVQAQLEELRAARTIPELKQELKEDITNYQAAVAPYVPTPSAPLVASTGFSFIPEEEYEENDEYDKIKLELYRDDLQYVLVVDGETVLDWKTILTEEILEEIKGKDCLFLRNEDKKADYEVSWATP